MRTLEEVRALLPEGNEYKLSVSAKDEQGMLSPERFSLDDPKINTSLPLALVVDSGTSLTAQALEDMSLG